MKISNWPFQVKNVEMGDISSEIASFRRSSKATNCEQVPGILKFTYIDTAISVFTEWKLYVQPLIMLGKVPFSPLESTARQR